MLLTDSTTIITRDNIQVLHIENTFASADISLFGGHILSFIPKLDSRDRLWVSEKAVFDGKKAIRGGIPICWPWFGAHTSNSNLPAHGYVRTQTWEILSSEESDLGTRITLKPKTTQGNGFTGQTKLCLVVQVGKALSIQLHTTNIGSSTFTYNCALHSYFAIANIEQCSLVGLNGQYSDKTRNYELFDTPAPYQFNEETDRVHFQQPRELTIIDNQLSTKILSAGHDSIVVWNPWQDKSISMDDMANDSYSRMLCVETAVTQNQEVRAGETHILEQVII